MEITEAVQVVTPPRSSVTVTVPSWPLMVLELTEAPCDPSDTLAVGALMDSAPGVSVKVVGLEASAAGAARAAAARNAAVVLARSKNFRM